MSHHVEGALGSKWGNPFKVNKKNSRNKCLERYEDHIRKNPYLFNAVMELEGKELRCWCKPSPCHGDILIKLFKERQFLSLCTSGSSFQEFSPLTQSGRNGENDGDNGVSEPVLDDTDKSVFPLENNINMVIFRVPYMTSEVR